MNKEALFQTKQRRKIMTREIEALEASLAQFKRGENWDYSEDIDNNVPDNWYEIHGTQASVTGIVYKAADAYLALLKGGHETDVIVPRELKNGLTDYEQKAMKRSMEESKKRMEHKLDMMDETQ